MNAKDYAEIVEFVEKNNSWKETLYRPDMDFSKPLIKYVRCSIDTRDMVTFIVQLDDVFFRDMEIDGLDMKEEIIKYLNDKNYKSKLMVEDNSIDYMNLKGTKLLEKMSDLAHEQWSGWMTYLFLLSAKNTDGTVTIPKWAVERWIRQMQTHYTELSIEEQDSDRKEALKFIELAKKHKRDL